MTIPICCVQSTASSPLMYVTCTSPGVAADTGGRNGPAYFLANEIHRFLVTHRLRLLRWTTSPAMSLPSLTVVSHSGRLSGSRLRLFWCATSLMFYVFAIADRRFSQPSSHPDPTAAPYSVVPPWALDLSFLGWLRVQGSWGFGWRRHFWLFGSGLVVGFCRFSRCIYSI
jgi:hypothetical protein